MSARRRRTTVTASLTFTCLVLATALAAAPAAAAKPANQACFGSDLSTYARKDGAHGALVSHLAHTYGGLGQLTQLHQAGALPDESFENSCND